MNEKPTEPYGAASAEADLLLEDIPRRDDPVALVHEARVQKDLDAQFAELKRQARGIFKAVEGRIGATNQEYLETVFEKASEDYANGAFLIQRLGADRQLDLPLVATLTQLRNGLLAQIENPTAADHMAVNSAIVSYRNYLRVQGWIGSICMEVERTLFGQTAAEVVIGRVEAEEVLARLERLGEKLLPSLERSQRMLFRALDRVEPSRKSTKAAQVSVGVAGQVNVG